MIPPEAFCFSGESVLFFRVKEDQIYGKNSSDAFGKTMTIHSLWAGDSEMSHLKHTFSWVVCMGKKVLLNCTILSSKSIFYMLLVIDHVQAGPKILLYGVLISRV